MNSIAWTCDTCTPRSTQQMCQVDAFDRQGCVGALLLLRACRGAIPADVRVLPDRIILVRHAQSEGNVDCGAYTYIPDPQVPLVSGQGRQSNTAHMRTADKQV
eukprot:GHRQ01031086.1.p1 GENE.GHRQ01031086.1~~GHRQ01031086.1.p1  ORF type:complete len:103 (+),score=33.77 GHRQ01031086.1:300-608(+)